MKTRGILFLHGGGSSGTDRYRDLSYYFNRLGLLTHTFTHQATSLSGRLEEAEAELAKFKSINSLADSALAIWGSSMGAHIACRLSATHPDFAALILQSAAAYSLRAETAPFGPAFTYALETTASWVDSPAIIALNKYPGPVLVMHGDGDAVIPAEVQKLYRDRASSRGQYLTITGGGHSLLRPQTTIERQAWSQMANSALKFLQSL